MEYKVKEQDGYHFIEEGDGPVLLLLHGLMGALSNWKGVVDGFKDHYKVVIPMMPIYEMPIKETSLEGLTDFVDGFINWAKFDQFTLVGNSLGGHVAILYTLKYPQKVKHLVLTGSSGLFENTMGGSYPKRGSYEYIKERVEYTFYDPATATKELVDDVFDLTNSIPKCMRIVAMAKSAQRNNLSDKLHQISTPTCLIWGLNDTITPPAVGHDFNRMIPTSQLHFIDKCCHAPMMERPSEFNTILKGFLDKN